jgi:hypothetical protein
LPLIHKLLYVMPRRQDTLNVTESSRFRTTTSETAKSGKVKQFFTAYADFPWEKIETYLQGKWPNWRASNMDYVSTV